MLDLLSDKVACVTARYSFHIDVVSSQVNLFFLQVKTFPRHFTQEKSFTPSKAARQEKEEKELTEKKTEKVVSNNSNEKETMKR